MRTAEAPRYQNHLPPHPPLNRAALSALGITKDTPNPPGGVIEKAFSPFLLSILGVMLVSLPVKSTEV